MVDGFSARYGDLLYGSYDCVDRIVLNAYYPLGHNPGGFRTWWRRLHGDDAQLDNAHLMRMAGRFARRVRASAAAHGIPVIDCKRGERKHEIAEEYLATHRVDRGVFLIFVARAVAPVWEVTRSTGGVLCNLVKKRAFVNHYSFHILDPEWGHMTIKMSGHPPRDNRDLVARDRGVPHHRAHQRPHRGHQPADQAGETRRLRIPEPGELPTPSTVALHPAHPPIVSEEPDGARLRSKSPFIGLVVGLIAQTRRRTVWNAHRRRAGSGVARAGPDGKLSFPP